MAQNGAADIDYLKPIAHQLFSLRGQNSNHPQMKKIGDYLEAETVRAYGWSVPKEISPNVDCFISTTFFLRKHLPGRFLHKNFFPVVVSPKAPYFAMPLPEIYWPEELLLWWYT